jgi:hypothetical protein
MPDSLAKSKRLCYIMLAFWLHLYVPGFLPHHMYQEPGIDEVLKSLLDYDRKTMITIVLRLENLMSFR